MVIQYEYPITLSIFYTVNNCVFDDSAILNKLPATLKHSNRTAIPRLTPSYRPV